MQLIRQKRSGTLIKADPLARPSTSARPGKVLLYLTLEIAAVAVVLLWYSWGMGLISTVLR